MQLIGCFAHLFSTTNVLVFSRSTVSHSSRFSHYFFFVENWTVCGVHLSARCGLLAVSSAATCSSRPRWTLSPRGKVHGLSIRHRKCCATMPWIVLLSTIPLPVTTYTPRLRKFGQNILFSAVDSRYLSCSEIFQIATPRPAGLARILGVFLRPSSSTSHEPHLKQKTQVSD